MFHQQNADPHYTNNSIGKDHHLSEQNVTLANDKPVCIQCKGRYFAWIMRYLYVYKATYP